MPADITYDIANSDGGSPFWASHKEFTLMASNLGKTRAEVEDDADSSDWETPCIQNRMEGFVTIRSDFDYIDANVTVWGHAIESGTVTGTGRVTGGIAWVFSDYKGSRFASGRIDGASPPAAPKATPAYTTFPMRIPNLRKTKVCDAVSAGGIQIAPNPGSFYVSTVVTIVMGFVVQPINGYFHGHEDSTAFASASGQPVLLASAETGSGSLVSSGRPTVLYKSGEQFYDAQLRKEIGEMASAFEGEEMDREVQGIIERESKNRGKRNGGRKA